MSELKRDSREGVTTIHEKWAVWVGRNTGYKQNRTARGLLAGPYDALDYRLMATFPASDAVAQY